MRAWLVIAIVGAVVVTVAAVALFYGAMVVSRDPDPTLVVSKDRPGARPGPEVLEADVAARAPSLHDALEEARTSIYATISGDSNVREACLYLVELGAKEAGRGCRLDITYRGDTYSIDPQAVE